MIKSIIKEVFIMILLIAAILLIFGILFYEYNPSNKKVPTPVAEYSLPQEMQEELNETLESQETQNIVKTYRIDADDLKAYERTKDYKKGKTNPFASSIQKTTSNNTTSENSGTGNSSTSNENNSSGGSSNNNEQNTDTTNNNETPQNTSQGRFLNEVK